MSTKELFQAVKDDKLEVVKYFIEERGINPNVKDFHGCPLILFAASKNEITEYLVSQGADINARMPRADWLEREYYIPGGTVLHVAIFISEILMRNAMPELVRESADCLEKYIQCLHRLGIDLNAGDRWGETVLCLAADYSDIALTAQLLSLDARVNTNTKGGRTALHASAASEGLPEIDECILNLFISNGGNINAVAKTNAIQPKLLRSAYALFGVATHKTPLDYANTDSKRKILRDAGGKYYKELH